MSAGEENSCYPILPLLQDQKTKKEKRKEKRCEVILWDGWLFHQVYAELGGVD